MDIVKDIKGNIVNVGDTVKFRNCDFEILATHSRDFSHELVATVES